MHNFQIIYLQQLQSSKDPPYNKLRYPKCHLTKSDFSENWFQQVSMVFPPTSRHDNVQHLVATGNKKDKT